MRRESLTPQTPRPTKWVMLCMGCGISTTTQFRAHQHNVKFMRLNLVDFPLVTMFGSFTAGVPTSLDKLTELELQVGQDVFRSGIAAGSTRADLQARGLIH